MNKLRNEHKEILIRFLNNQRLSTKTRVVLDSETSPVNILDRRGGVGQPIEDPSEPFGQDFGYLKWPSLKGI